MSTAPVFADTLTDLAQLPAQACATVTDVVAGQSDTQRLMGLGICVGRRLRLLKGGDPLILQVYGTRIGLSARLARVVRVMVQASGSAASDR